MPDTNVTYGSYMSYTNFSGISLPNYGDHAQTFLKPLFKIGDSTNKATIGTTLIPLVEIQATSALTTGIVKAMNINMVTTATMTAGSVYGLCVTIDTDYKIGGSNTAIYGKIDLSDTGAIHGMASGICAEMILPNSSLSRGAAYALELQLGGGASTSWASAGPVAFIYCGGWGSGLVSQMNTRGYLIDIQGFAEGSNLLVDSDGSPTATGGIRCRVGTTDIWLLYRDSAPA